MSDDKLTKEQQEQLQKALDDIIKEAKNVVEDYTKNPSAASGSIHPNEAKVKGVGVMVGMDSEYLDETKEMDGDNFIEVGGKKDGSKKENK